MQRAASKSESSSGPSPPLSTIPVLDLAGDVSAIISSPSLFLPWFLFHQPHYCWRGLLCLSCPSSSLLWYSCFGAGTIGMQRAQKACGLPLPIFSLGLLALLLFLSLFYFASSNGHLFSSCPVVFFCFILFFFFCFHVHTGMLFIFISTRARTCSCLSLSFAKDFLISFAIHNFSCWIENESDRGGEIQPGTLFGSIRWPSLQC